MIAFKRKKNNFKGKGIINSLINSLPFNLTPPSYRYCGPGTPIEDYLKRNVPPKNLLDKSCQKHDQAYLEHQDLDSRHQADRELRDAAWERFKSSDASLDERALAWVTTNLMKAKLAMGAGCGGSKKGKGLKKKRGKKVQNKKKGVRKLNAVRVIPLPRTGGILQYLIPLLTGLTNIGSVASTAKDLVSTVQKLKGGKGLHKKGVLAPFKRGFGLYLRPYEPEYYNPNL